MNYANLRMPGCRECEQTTSGDCGMHGPVTIRMNLPFCTDPEHADLRALAALARDVLSIPAVAQAVGRNHVGDCACPVCRLHAALDAARGTP